MKKITYEEKISTLDRYIAHPQGIHDPEILRAVKTDVVRANSKNVSKASEPQDNKLYNECMGIYREFLKSRDSHLDMTGRKAIFYSAAMKNIINYIRSFAGANGKSTTDENVKQGVEFLFTHWENLNDYHNNRIQLPDIYDKIEEILPMIKNGYNKKSANKNDLQQLKQSLKRG